MILTVTDITDTLNVYFIPNLGFDFYFDFYGEFTSKINILE